MHTSAAIQEKIKKVRLAFSALSVYRPLLQDGVMDSLRTLINYLDGDSPDLFKSLELYNSFFFGLVHAGNTASLRDYIIDKVIYDDNPFSRQAEALDFNGLDNTIKAAAIKDLDLLQAIAELPAAAVKACLTQLSASPELSADIIEALPSWELESSMKSDEGVKGHFHPGNRWSNSLEALSEFHRKHGCGMFARYKAFLWERSGGIGSLKGIASPDAITLSDLIGYDIERSEVINNTLQFLDGYPANNVLLYGDRGTGKSSTVKALLNEHYLRGLRVIEVPKAHLIDFPEIVRNLRDRHQKFIVFVDDLAFEDNEESYTALKAVLEGGLESRPKNVLIYATSNRRHLIKEKFSDRAGLQSGNTDDEIRAADTMQEKLSLADRFGITIVFSSPDKYKYLEIVEGIAAKRGLCVDKQFLHREALKWELWYNGRSPRTARQFVDWLEGQVKGSSI